MDQPTPGLNDVHAPLLIDRTTRIRDVRPGALSLPVERSEDCERFLRHRMDCEKQT
ncbi:MAG: hypothetical protein ACO3MW_11865 [Rhodospirillales bacterium]